MSKESFIGGDYIETTGGSTKIFAKGFIENIGSQVIQDGKANGILYGINDPVPIIEKTDGTVQGFWLDVKENEIDSAILGEEVKIKLLLQYDAGTALSLIIKAKNESGEINYTDNKKPIEISVIVPENKEFITKPIHLNPHHFYKKEDEIKFSFHIKESPVYESKPLSFKGFGKPDIFKKDKSKSYMYKKLDDGSSVAYVSGVRLDILTYQKWFEDESDELTFSNEKQISSYFENVYLTYLLRWSIRGEYGNETNRNRIIAAFEKAGKKHNVAPSILYMYATGEGMKIRCSLGTNTDLDKPVNSFKAFGLDFFETEAANLKAKGYLDKSFNSAGKAIVDLYAADAVYPKPFNSKYAVMRDNVGRPLTRLESADNGKIADIYPVFFKNLEAGIEGACALYARSYNDAATSAKKIGWGNLTLNEHVFFGYLKIQKTSTLGNAEINLYRKKRTAKFLDESYTTIIKDGGLIPNKAYHRWVAWRYILLGKHFSK